MKRGVWGVAKVESLYHNAFQLTRLSAPMAKLKEPKWRIHRGHAAVEWQDYQLHLEPHCPQEGISLKHPSVDQPQRLFTAPNVEVFAGEILDPYCQGNKLVVPYPCTDKRIFGGELSWRVRPFSLLDFSGIENEAVPELSPQQDEESSESEPDTLTVELVYSTQTNLLDTHPRQELKSVVNGEAIEYFAMDQGRLDSCRVSDPFVACLIRRSGISTLLTSMPSDLESCSVEFRTRASKEVLATLTWKLVVDFLEKGVIRRFRVFSANGQNPDSLLAAAEAFYRSEIPLTA